MTVKHFREIILAGLWVAAIAHGLNLYYLSRRVDMQLEMIEILSERIDLLKRGATWRSNNKKTAV
jgi:hypothetical protein